MRRISQYYDRVNKKQSLNSTLSQVVCFSFICCMGIFQIIKYFKNHDSFYVYAGIWDITIGVFGIWSGSQMLHAVVRRLLAEAQKTQN
jgi:uncharacterized membrane protein HdeD (DUF308 family)